MASSEDSADSEEKRSGRWGWLSPLLRHPLTASLVVVAIGSWLIPSWFQHSQDRQSELSVKSALVDQIAGTTTMSVRQAITRVTQNTPRASTSSAELKAAYNAAIQNWLVSRALIRAKLATYFPRLEPGWYTYSDVVTSYLSIPQPDVKSAGYLEQVRAYVTDTGASECAPGAHQDFDTARFCNLRSGITWAALKSVHDKGFAGAYDRVGELLLIYKDRYTAAVNGSDAAGFGARWPF